MLPGLLLGLPAQAALQGFPANEGLVAIAVGGAFALPAMLAGLFVGLRRVGQSLGPLVAATVILLMGLVLMAYVRPELMSVAGI